MRVLPTAPAPAGQQGDDPIVARAASSTATAARAAPHGIVRTLTRTTQKPPAVSPCDHAIAHSNPTSIAKRPSRAQIRLVDRARLGSLSAVNDELGSDWPFRELPVAFADQVVRGEVPASLHRHRGEYPARTRALRPPESSLGYQTTAESDLSVPHTLTRQNARLPKKLTPFAPPLRLTHRRTATRSCSSAARAAARTFSTICTCSTCGISRCSSSSWTPRATRLSRVAPERSPRFP